MNVLVATGFGLGLVAPFAPGTVGSVPGVVLAYFMSYLPLWGQVAACAALVFLSIPVCGAAERRFGIKDDGRITADEWMLYPVALVGLPLHALAWWELAAFFVVIRALDIVKLPPARQMQALPGGWGIVLDDFVSNLQSLGVNWLLYLCVFSR